MSTAMGYCGIECKNCEIHKAANDAAFAEELAEKWRQWSPRAEAEWFQCQGCKGEDTVCWGGDCKIRACAKEKKVDHCGQCDDFKCQLIIDFENDEHKHHTDAVKHLETLSNRM